MLINFSLLDLIDTPHKVLPGMKMQSSAAAKVDIKSIHVNINVLIIFIIILIATLALRRGKRPSDFPSKLMRLVRRFLLPLDISWIYVSKEVIIKISFTRDSTFSFWNEESLFNGVSRPFLDAKEMNSGKNRYITLRMALFPSVENMPNPDGKL